MVVDRFGPQFADRLEGIPGTENLRLEMLRETARYYEQFLEYARHDSTLRWDSAVVHYQLATIQERMGQINTAIASYQSAINSFNSLSESHQVTDAQCTIVAGCLRNLASLQGRLGEKLSAQTNFHRALKLLADSRGDSGSDVETLCERAKTKSDASIFFAGQSNHAQALQLLDEAIDGGLQQARAHGGRALLLRAMSSSSCRHISRLYCRAAVRASSTRTWRPPSDR